MMNNNTNQQNDYQSKLNAFYDNEDKNQLEQLRQKYSTVPNYKNMSLRDELQTRFDLNQMNDLEKRVGTAIIKEPDCYMQFDGQNLTLYNKGIQSENLAAMSGHKNYQARKYQNVKDLGPIPEGIYYANQNQRQTISVEDAFKGAVASVFKLDRGKWKGSLPAWGTKRVWLQPDANTNTYGRSGFTIHGGLSKGSAGCIDIPWQTSKLSNYLDGCQNSVPVYVKYPKEKW